MVVLLPLVALPTTCTALEATLSLRRRRLSVGHPSMSHRTQTLTFADDVATATRRLRGDFPGQDKEAKKAGEEGYEQVRATAQQMVGLLLQLCLLSMCTNSSRLTKPMPRRERLRRNLIPSAPTQRGSLRRPRRRLRRNTIRLVPRSMLPPTNSMPLSKRRQRRHRAGLDRGSSKRWTFADTTDTRKTESLHMPLSTGVYRRRLFISI
jgi:hypothetical protein